MMQPGWYPGPTISRVLKAININILNNLDFKLEADLHAKNEVEFELLKNRSSGNFLLPDKL
jgi:hypothetical protein